VETKVAAALPAKFENYKSPGSAIARFVSRRTFKSAVLWAFIFAIYMASKSVGYAKAYPTVSSRIGFTKSLGNNVGLNAILGTPHSLVSIAGYTAWNVFGIISLIGAVWGLLIATKYFRGEEEKGRSELLLTGQTTQKNAALNILGGLGSCWLILLAVTALLFAVIGKIHTLNFTVSGSLFFALASVSSIALFISVGAFTSQLMPTRTRASTIAVAFFGLSFLIRAMADTTSSHWLLNLTPLGWIEKLQPLSGSQPIWLLPIIGLILIFCILTVWLAGNRDLGSSTFADHDSAKAKTWLLNTPLAAAIRLTRAASLTWLLVIFIFGFFYGLITKSAIKALDSRTFNHGLTKIEHTSHINLGELFLGIVFFMLMVLIMAYVASAMTKVREDEAEGYVDNLLVRKVSRLNWLAGRVGIIVVVVGLSSLTTSVAVWLGTINQGLGFSFHTLWLAGLNAVIPALLAIGICVFCYGFFPRRTALVAYGIIAWSFLIDIVSSGINLNHYIMDTSVLSHISFAPATAPRWGTALNLIGVGVVLAILGAWRFNRRDLASE